MSLRYMRNLMRQHTGQKGIIVQKVDQPRVHEYLPRW
jgi:hypothetical protein